MRRAAVPLLTILVVLGGGGLGRAAAVPAGSGAARRAVVQRPVAVPAGASVTGPVAASAPLHLTLSLTPSDPHALAAYAAQVSDPASALYRHYLSVDQFAARFGASASEVSAVRGALTQAGLSVAPVAANGLALTVVGSAAEAEGAFATQLEQVTLPTGRVAYADVTDPTLPSAAASAVQGIAGLDSLPAAAPQNLLRARGPHPELRTGRALAGAAGPSSCSAAQSPGAYTAAQIGDAYGMDTAWKSGDLGAGTTVALVEGCSLAADDPAVQPYVTGVGGTSMPSDIPGAAETVWNDGPGGGAGGGGVSRDWALPSYQSGFAQAQSAIGCSLVPGGSSTSTNCREVPDVSADADPATGYDIYWTPPPQASSTGGWVAAGGTSAAAPTWASLVALADSSSACTAAGARVGFANALLYGLPATDFNDVTQGQNSYDGVPGYGAGAGYDMASGRGTPNGSALLPALCGSSPTPSPTSTTPTSAPGPSRPAPTPTSAPPSPPSAPPTQTTSSAPGRIDVVRFTGHRAERVARVGRGVRLHLRAWDRDGLRLRYTARRLPRGLRINHRTGLIIGRPRRAGRQVSSITAQDSRGDWETIMVRWLVMGGGVRSAPAHRHGRFRTL